MPANLVQEYAATIERLKVEKAELLAALEEIAANAKEPAITSTLRRQRIAQNALAKYPREPVMSAERMNVVLQRKLDVAEARNVELLAALEAALPTLQEACRSNSDVDRAIYHRARDIVAKHHVLAKARGSQS